MPNFKLNQSIYNVLENGEKDNRITQAQRNLIFSKITPANIPSIGARKEYLDRLNAIPIVG
jgi:hypothetical protein